MTIGTITDYVADKITFGIVQSSSCMDKTCLHKRSIFFLIFVRKVFQDVLSVRKKVSVVQIMQLSYKYTFNPCSSVVFVLSTYHSFIDLFYIKINSRYIPPPLHIGSILRNVNQHYML